MFWYTCVLKAHIWFGLNSKCNEELQGMKMCLGRQCLPLTLHYSRALVCHCWCLRGKVRFLRSPQVVYCLTDYFRRCMYCHCSARPAVSHVGSSHPLLTSRLSSICLRLHANMRTDVHFWRGIEDSFIVASEWAVSSAFMCYFLLFFNPLLLLDSSWFVPFALFFLMGK